MRDGSIRSVPSHSDSSYLCGRFVLLMIRKQDQIYRAVTLSTVAPLCSDIENCKRSSKTCFKMCKDYHQGEL